MKSRNNPFLRYTAALAIACSASAQATDYTVTEGNTQNFSNATYTSANLLLQGGTVSGSGNYNAYGASVITGATVTGSVTSTITGSSFFNINPSTTFIVADVTGTSATDLSVSISLRGPTGNPDTTFNTGTLIKEGAGTMTLTAGTYNLNTTINAGTIELSGVTGGYGFVRNGTIRVNSGGTLSLTGGDGTGFGYQADSPTSLIIDGGTVTSTTAGGCHVTNMAITMTGGTLQTNNGVSDASGQAFSMIYSNVTTNTSEDTATIDGRMLIRNDFSNNDNLAFNVANGAAATDLLVSAAITQLYSGGAITKTGDGTMVLSGANTYTGETKVSAGKLVVNGSNSGATGAVTVASGAILGGIGTIGGATTISGTHAPGNSPGVQSFSGNLTYATGSVFEWEIDRSSAQTRGTGYDAVNVAGTLSGTQAKFKIVIGDNGFTDAFWDTTQNWTDIFTGADGTTAKTDWASIFSGGFEYSYNNGSTLTSISPTGQGSFSFTNSGTTLTWTAVPEPTSALAGLLITVGLLRRRRD